eukprot:2110132-Rhodomonas_salina.2
MLAGADVRRGGARAQELGQLVKQFKWTLKRGSIIAAFNIGLTRAQASMLRWLFNAFPEVRSALASGPAPMRFEMAKAPTVQPQLFSRLNDNLVAHIYKHVPELAFRHIAVCKQLERRCESRCWARELSSQRLDVD